jgi:hypothetical protein
MYVLKLVHVERTEICYDSLNIQTHNDSVRDKY